jgi:hypothetical protein
MEHAQSAALIEAQQLALAIKSEIVAAIVFDEQDSEGE